ncbi:general substrate transporter [Schizophyllum amplum]|uniref:General substrate transporter n=1 Tax=Schizophyllum amplum TaxID=97359 RepID=A0A550CTX3_9AGAR|nr:general substrate transporter [Auriculariopsis ampla]
MATQHAASASSAHSHDEKERISSPTSIAPPPTAPILEVTNADYALAVSEQKLNPYSWSSIRLFAVLAVAFMGSMSNGFDGQVMGAVNGMQQYLDYFGISGTDAGGGVGTVTALIFGIYYIGQIAGMAVAGPLADRLGRRGGMFVGAVIIIVGAIVVTLAKNTGYLLGGRFVLGFGVSITTTACPAYVVEMSPPQWRGRLTGLYNSSYYVGSILCTGVAIGTEQLSGTTSWRAPLAIQLVPAGILIIFSLWLPESPRWLLATGKPEQARAVLAKYHGEGDPNAPLVQLQWREFEEAIKVDASDKRWYDYSELVNTADARYRTFMMLLMAFFGQWSGNGLGYFLTVLFKNSGVESQRARLVLNFINTIVSAIGAFIGTALTDKVGRRRMWFWGTLASATMLAIATACTAEFGETGSSKSGSNSAIAFIFLFGFCYSLTYTPLQALYPSEVLHYNTRAKGMACYSLAVSCASFVNTYAGPIALERIQWKYYIVYVVWDIFECAMIWFFAVETMGRTLEELAEIFSDPHPVRASLRTRKVAVVEKETGDKHIIEVAQA